MWNITELSYSIVHLISYQSVLLFFGGLIGVGIVWRLIISCLRIVRTTDILYSRIRKGFRRLPVLIFAISTISPMLIEAQNCPPSGFDRENLSLEWVGACGQCLESASTAPIFATATANAVSTSQAVATWTPAPTLTPIPTLTPTPVDVCEMLTPAWDGMTPPPICATITPTPTPIPSTVPLFEWYPSYPVLIEEELENLPAQSPLASADCFVTTNGGVSGEIPPDYSYNASNYGCGDYLGGSTVRSLYARVEVNFDAPQSIEDITYTYYSSSGSSNARRTRIYVDEVIVSDTTHSNNPAFNTQRLTVQLGGIVGSQVRILYNTNKSYVSAYVRDVTITTDNLVVSTPTPVPTFTPAPTLTPTSTPLGYVDCSVPLYTDYDNEPLPVDFGSLYVSTQCYTLLPTIDLSIIGITFDGLQVCFDLYDVPTINLFGVVVDVVPFVMVGAILMFIRLFMRF
jgi:hypothetical protein